MSKALLEVQVEEAVCDAARAEAIRRGTVLDDMVEDALRRYLAAQDLGRLTAALRRRAESDPDRLSDDEAAAIASEELTAWRALQST